MNIVFDLDGTLIDSKRRLYSLFQALAPTSDLSYSDYWKLKQKKVSNQAILAERLGFDAIQIQSFINEWMTLIEAPEYLKLDKIFPHVHDALEKLHKIAVLHVCTARQDRNRAVEQLRQLGLFPFFKNVLVTKQCLQKQDLISRYLSPTSQMDWMIGDTGKDILCGKALGMRTCAVSSGFLSRESLLEYKPEFIVESVIECKSLILKIIELIDKKQNKK